MIKHYRENKDSLIGRIFGIYTIRSNRFPRLSVILMENLLQMQTVKDKENLLKFDLKGSTIDRLELDPQKSTLKDVNLLCLLNETTYLRKYQHLLHGSHRQDKLVLDFNESD
jgi:hypothetical protein